MEITNIFNNVIQTQIEIDQEREYDFSISIGCAKYDSELDKSLFDTAIRADKEMYQRKKEGRKRKQRRMDGH